MGLNRMMFVKRSASGGIPENVFVMTMGQQSGQYGYSRNSGNYGEVTGNVTHDGRAVTLVILSYYGGWLDVAFKEEGVTSGSRNIALNITPMETGVTVPPCSWENIVSKCCNRFLHLRSTCAVKYIKHVYCRQCR